MKLKPLLAILAALCLIVLGALLPDLVARRQQRQREGQVLFARVGDVELDFSSSDLTFSQILSIYAEGRNPVEIPRELATLREEKVRAIAASAAEKLWEEGLLLTDPGQDGLTSSQTVLYYGRENQSNIYWLLHWGDSKGTYTLTLVLDDSTGTLCALEYKDQESGYEPEQMEQVLEGFCRIYLTGLGEEFFPLSAGELTQAAKAPQDQSYLATELEWTDPVYGEKQLTFFVNRSGFYTYFGR